MSLVQTEHGVNAEQLERYAAANTIGTGEGLHQAHDGALQTVIIRAEVETGRAGGSPGLPFSTGVGFAEYAINCHSTHCPRMRMHSRVLRIELVQV